VAKAFGRVVRKEREGQGIAQDAFALLANVDRSYYGKLERGERQLSLGLLLRISSGLGATGAEIVNRVERELRK
jgi:transcriptional regulator with XRE-family HTH domain